MFNKASYSAECLSANLEKNQIEHLLKIKFLALSVRYFTPAMISSDDSNKIINSHFCNLS